MGSRKSLKFIPFFVIFNAVNYANLVAERTARITTKSIAKRIAKEPEKILTEKISRKKITEFIDRLKKE